MQLNLLQKQQTKQPKGNLKVTFEKIKIGRRVTGQRKQNVGRHLEIAASGYIKN